MGLTIVLSSNNKHKLQEIKAILKNIDVNILTPEELNIPHQEVVEDGATYYENAIKKASSIAKYTTYPVMSDDSGLEIEALDNKPGINSARFAKSLGGYDCAFEYIFKSLGDNKRNARFVCHIALCNVKKEPLVFKGECIGKIACKILGDNGFGYDPIFIPNNFNCSFAQLNSNQKNSISHRSDAIKKMVKYLKENNLM